MDGMGPKGGGATGGNFRILSEGDSATIKLHLHDDSSSSWLTIFDLLIQSMLFQDPPLLFPLFAFLLWYSTIDPGKRYRCETHEHGKP